MEGVLRLKRDLLILLDGLSKDETLSAELRQLELLAHLSVPSPTAPVVYPKDEPPQYQEQYDRFSPPTPAIHNTTIVYNGPVGTSNVSRSPSPMQIDHIDPRLLASPVPQAQPGLHQSQALYQPLGTPMVPEERPQFYPTHDNAEKPVLTGKIPRLVSSIRHRVVGDDVPSDSLYYQQMVSTVGMNHANDRSTPNSKSSITHLIQDFVHGTHKGGVHRTPAKVMTYVP